MRVDSEILFLRIGWLLASGQSRRGPILVLLDHFWFLSSSTLDAPLGTRTGPGAPSPRKGFFPATLRAVSAKAPPRGYPLGRPNVALCVGEGFREAGKHGGSGRPSLSCGWVRRNHPFGLKRSLTSIIQSLYQ